MNRGKLHPGVAIVAANFLLAVSSSPFSGMIPARAQTSIAGSLSSLVSQGNLLHSELSVLVRSAEDDRSINQKSHDIAAELKGVAKDAENAAKERKMSGGNTLDGILGPMSRQVIALCAATASYQQTVSRAALSGEQQSQKEIVAQSTNLTDQMNTLDTGIKRLKAALGANQVDNLSLQRIHAIKDSMFVVVQRLEHARKTWQGR
jgi:hypothetical protein